MVARRIDITMPLFEGMPTFPGDAAFSARPLRSLDRGDPFNLATLTLSSHAGTHLDAPSHVLSGGATLDAVDLGIMNGRCQVLEVDSSVSVIDASHLESLRAGVERVLLRTANSARWSAALQFFPDYVGLGLAAAGALVRRGVRLVGIDALSVENDATGTFPVHRALLGEGVLILEGLLLADAAPGDYRLECLPLRWRGGDGAPARAVLRTE